MDSGIFHEKSFEPSFGDGNLDQRTLITIFSIRGCCIGFFITTTLASFEPPSRLESEPAIRRRKSSEGGTRIENRAEERRQEKKCLHRTSL